MFYMGWDSEEKKRGVLYLNHVPFANIYRLGAGLPNSGQWAFNRSNAAIKMNYHLNETFVNLFEMIDKIRHDLNVY